jgi:hypothetical protein
VHATSSESAIAYTHSRLLCLSVYVLAFAHSSRPVDALGFVTAVPLRLLVVFVYAASRLDRSTIHDRRVALGGQEESRTIRRTSSSRELDDGTFVTPLRPACVHTHSHRWCARVCRWADARSHCELTRPPPSSSSCTVSLPSVFTMSAVASAQPTQSHADAPSASAASSSPQPSSSSIIPATGISHLAKYLFVTAKLYVTRACTHPNRAGSGGCDSKCYPIM